MTNPEPNLRIDCQHYSLNVQINVLVKSTSSKLSKDIIEELKDIDSRLREKVVMDSLIIVADKYFRLTGNYSKGYENMFRAYLEKYHLNILLYHIPNAKGNR